MIPGYIENRIYRVRGSDCAIWLGSYRNNSCTYRHPDGNAVNVRTLVCGQPPQGTFYGRPSCHNGRCLTRKHQRLAAYVTAEAA